MSCAIPHSDALAATPSDAQRATIAGVVREADEPSAATQFTAQGAPPRVAESEDGSGGPPRGATSSMCVAPESAKERRAVAGPDATAAAVTRASAAAASSQLGTFGEDHSNVMMVEFEYPGIGRTKSASQAAAASVAIPPAAASALTFAGVSVKRVPSAAPATLANRPGTTALSRKTEPMRGKDVGNITAGTTMVVDIPYCGYSRMRGDGGVDANVHESVRDVGDEGGESDGGGTAEKMRAADRADAPRRSARVRRPHGRPRRVRPPRAVPPRARA